MVRVAHPAGLNAWGTVLIAVLCLVSAAGRANSSLTELEKRWLNAAGPVLDYADALNLPLDIIVQPQPGDVPLAMGFDHGRCKLVLSLRHNPKAEAILATLDPAQRHVAIEIMAAHELAHCLRRVSEWQTNPAGFTAASGTRPDEQHPALREKIEQTRREEGFADLFGLAWTLQHHPTLYSRIHGWIGHVREQDSSPGDPHDTRDWLQLAGERSAFDSRLPLLEQAETIWKRGLPGH